MSGKDRLQIRAYPPTWRLILIKVDPSFFKQVSPWQIFWGTDIFFGPIPILKLFLFVDLLIHLYV